MSEPRIEFRFDTHKRLEVYRATLVYRRPEGAVQADFLLRDRFLAAGDWRIVIEPVPARTKLWAKIVDRLLRVADRVFAWILNEEPRIQDDKDKKN